MIALLRAYHVWLERRFAPPPTDGVAGPPEAAPVPSFGRTLGLGAVRLVAYLTAALLVVEAWGFDVVAWADTPTGQAVINTFLRIVIIVGALSGLAFLANRLALKFMFSADPDVNLVYSNRVRTLASISRNLSLTILIFMAVMTVLSEIGVDTTALFAGAGVVGLAIGFGSQRLVQDLITGLFILLGNTIRVGDVVDLGGRSGAVEAMSMRTITLRAYNGSVHTIPYSSIDVVTNLTKDFSYAVFNVAVAYKEDVDKVMDVLRSIDSQLRREWPFRRLILEPIEIAGLDTFGPSSVNVMARVKTRPGDQWRVGREFNRRLKMRFDELRIEIPFPHQTVFFGTDREGKAPPFFIERARKEILAKERRAAEETEGDEEPVDASTAIASRA